MATVVCFPMAYVFAQPPIQPGKGLKVSFYKSLTNNNAVFIVTAYHQFSGKLRVDDLAVVISPQGDQDITGVDCTVYNDSASPVYGFYVRLTRIKP